MVRGNNISKFRMIKLMLKLDEEGSIINMPEKKVWENSGLEYIKVKSFKFEPYGANLGVYAIDGEVYRFKSIDNIFNFFIFRDMKLRKYKVLLWKRP